MRLFLEVLALLGVWSQSVPPGLVHTSVSFAGVTTSTEITINVSGSACNPIADVFVNFTQTGAPVPALMNWTAMGFASAGAMASNGLGTDAFVCNQDGTIQRYWLIGCQVAGMVNSLVPGGYCNRSVIGGVAHQFMRFQRGVLASNSNELSLKVGPYYFLTAFGDYNSDGTLMQHSRSPMNGLISFVTVPGTSSPTSKGACSPTTFAPTPAPPTQGAGEVVSGYPFGLAATCGVNVGWEVVGSSVRWGMEMSGVQWISIGFNNGAGTPPVPMTGDGVVAQNLGSNGSIAVWTLVYQGTPNTNPASNAAYFTSVSVTVTGNNLRADFVRTLAAPCASCVAIDPSSLYLDVAYGTRAFPAQHLTSSIYNVNLLSGASNSQVRSPAVQPKVFVAVVLGLCALFGLIFTVGLGHTTPGRILFFRRICKDSQFLGPRTCMCFDITVGQCTLLLIYFGMITIFSRMEFHYEVALKFLRCMGWTSTLCIACASIPVSRQSVLLPLFGMSFERAILIHRILGRTAVLIVLMHFVAVLLEPGYQPFDLKTPLVQPYNINLNLGFWAFMCLLVMFVTSLPIIRRKWFELFYYTHHLFIVVWVLAILHNQTLVHQLTLIIPFVLWGIDRMIRCYRGRLRKYELVSSTIIGDALRLEFKGKVTVCCPPTATESGSYAFINVPKVSHLQWHPFSISSRADADNFTFHIKNMGPGTYTGHLHEYFGKAHATPPVVHIDGPYGHCAVRFEEYESILLLAGGIGVTPMAAILDDLYEKCKSGRKPPRLESVVFSWSVQHKENVGVMEDLIKKIDAEPSPVTGVKFVIQVYVTRSKEESALYKAGRPKIPEVFALAERPKDGAGKEWRIGVLACGPEPMVVECQKQAMIMGHDFHKEIFAF